MQPLPFHPFIILLACKVCSTTPVQWFRVQHVFYQRWGTYVRHAHHWILHLAFTKLIARLLSPWQKPSSCQGDMRRDLLGPLYEEGEPGRDSPYNLVCCVWIQLWKGGSYLTTMGGPTPREKNPTEHGGQDERSWQLKAMSEWPNQSALGMPMSGHLTLHPFVDSPSPDTQPSFHCYLPFFQCFCPFLNPYLIHTSRASTWTNPILSTLSPALHSKH